MLSFLKKACAHLDMCLGSLFCMNQWSESLFLINGTSVVPSMLQKRSACGTMATNSPLDVNFGPVLQFWLSFGGLVRHPEECMAIRLEGNSALAAKNHIVESVSTLQNALCELQPLDFVGVSNQLAIGGSLQSPVLLLLPSLYHG